MKKKQKVQKERISFEIPAKDLEEIDRLAEKSNRSRSDMIRMLLWMAIDDVKLLDSVGLWTAINYGVNIFDKFKDALKDGDVKIVDGKANFPL